MDKRLFQAMAEEKKVKITIRCFMLMGMIFLSGCVAPSADSTSSSGYKGTHTEIVNEMRTGKADYARRVNSWTGQSEQKLIAAWGVPDKTYQTDPRTKVVEYIKAGTSGCAPSSCRTYFTIIGETVVSSKWEEEPLVRDL